MTDKQTEIDAIRERAERYWRDEAVYSLRRLVFEVCDLLDETRAEVRDLSARLATAEAEVARVRGLAEGWRALAADLRGSDKDHHPHDTVQARIFERCAREVTGGK